MTNRASKMGGVSKGKAHSAKASRSGLPPAQQRLLTELFCLSRDTQHISARTLAEAAELTATQAGAALVELERLGLVDASRARLTMRGLVIAAQLGAGSGGPRVARPLPEKRADVSTAWPVAALPSQPPPAHEDEPGEPAPAGHPESDPAPCLLS